MASKAHKEIETDDCSRKQFEADVENKLDLVLANPANVLRVDCSYSIAKKSVVYVMDSAMYMMLLKLFRASAKTVETPIVTATEKDFYRDPDDPSVWSSPKSRGPYED